MNCAEQWELRVQLPADWKSPRLFPQKLQADIFEDFVEPINHIFEGAF